MPTQRPRHRHTVNGSGTNAADWSGCSSLRHDRPPRCMDTHHRLVRKLLYEALVGNVLGIPSLIVARSGNYAVRR